MKSIVPFFELLQLALGIRATFSWTLTEAEWEEVYECAVQQAMVGICFAGIKRLPPRQQPPADLGLQWYGLSRQVEEQNRLLNRRSREACRYFERQGFMACVLKGQGNARLYPCPLLRQSGDIDVWVVAPREKADLPASRRRVLRWVAEQGYAEGFDLKHVHFPFRPDVETEVHFIPSQLHCLANNRRLHRFYADEVETQMAHRAVLDEPDVAQGSVACPTAKFNLVFQLTHLFEHFLSEGVGLRQVMDYYCVLKSGLPGAERAEAVGVIRDIGLRAFAGAVMWVLREVFGLEEAEMLVPMDERRGRVLLGEILMGGNFGQFESRYWHRGMPAWKFYVARMRRMVHFLRYYPREVLWDIPFRLCQRMWMLYASVRYSKVFIRH